jgi:hypothetical protein
MCDMITPGAVYRFNRNNNLRYYRAGRTKAGLDFLFPIHPDGSFLIEEHSSGRRYVVLYYITKWGKLAARGYWIKGGKPFKRVIVTDATVDDLDLVTEHIDELPEAARQLDDILNRFDVELDMDVWGELE